jgi:hypothetical protein
VTVAEIRTKEEAVVSAVYAGVFIQWLRGHLEANMHLID